MCTLLLTSAGFENSKIGEEFLRHIKKPPSELKLLFIPTAAITEEQQKFVEESKYELMQVGVSAENIHEYNLDHLLSYEQASFYDAIYVCGGSTLHLLNKIREVHFADTLKRLLDDGKLYIGVSAGSIVVGPRVRDEEGLHIIDRIIVPHYTAEAQEKVQALQSRTSYQVVPLTDAQALLVVGNIYTVVE